MLKWKLPSRVKGSFQKKYKKTEKYGIIYTSKKVILTGVEK